MKRRLTKGELRELFITNILRLFLTKQFDIGTGIIINQKEEQSNQTDIIIYDTRILPPFIKEQHIGGYPAESVVGVIEVKSYLDRNAIINSEKSTQRLMETVYNPKSSIYDDFDKTRPLCATAGFYGIGANEIRDKELGKVWLEAKVKYNFALCLIGKFSWMNLRKGGAISDNRKDYEETKRFIAVFLGNLRTHSDRNLEYLKNQSQFKLKDWLGIYIRRQDLF
ncbi:MAG: DUF6602 domain-containing protein [Thermodesulfobacteriota bacterium]